MITEDSRCDVEIKQELEWRKMRSTREELLTQRMDRKLKKKIIKAVVWSVANENEIDRLQKRGRDANRRNKK